MERRRHRAPRSTRPRLTYFAEGFGAGGFGGAAPPEGFGVGRCFGGACDAEGTGATDAEGAGAIDGVAAGVGTGGVAVIAGGVGFEGALSWFCHA